MHDKVKKALVAARDAELFTCCVVAYVSTMSMYTHGQSPATCLITHNCQADSLNAPECRVQITKGSAIFMGRVDSCFGWQVGGNEQGEFRTQLLCGGGKPAADQFCRYSFIPQPLIARHVVKHAAVAT